MAVVGHDLRNPLSGILATGWALGRLNLPPEAARMARRIVVAGRRMERLIRDLLDWSRVQGGAALRIAARPADLHDVCQRIADELGDRDGARLRIEREGDTRAVFDADRLEQIVCNLVSNALRHAPAETPVRVRAVGDGDEVRLEVQDEGPGVPQEARARIFEAFQQGPDGHRAGLGLGLFIVRALAEAHGGTVELASTPGRTTFVVRLRRGPLDETAEPARAG
jgi:signal transduction histidine kinase